MKDTFTRMDIKGRLIFVYPSPYVANNKLWLTYYIAKAKGQFSLGLLSILSYWLRCADIA